MVYGCLSMADFRQNPGAHSYCKVMHNISIWYDTDLLDGRKQFFWSNYYAE
jgi:hypothetical protein